MPHDVAISKFLLDVIPIAASSVSEQEMVSSFTKAVSLSFGIDNVNLSDAKGIEDQTNALNGYIFNTKKTYIDNQLSEYSAFPELINFKNRGFRSCAVMPLIADGKVVSLLEMLSKDENKFSEELVSSVAFGASFIGFVLMYKGELNRSVKLATYFDAAFNNQYPQLIISMDNSIVKFNKSAVKQFDMSVPEKRPVADILGLDFKRLVDISGTAYSTLVLRSGKNKGRVYQLVASKINDRLVHIAANDMTDALVYSTINDMLLKNNSLCVVMTDKDLMITNMTSNSETVFGYSRSVLVGRSLIDMVERAGTNPFEGKFADSLKRETDLAIGSVAFLLGETGKRYMRYTAKRFLDGYVFLLVRADVERYVGTVQNDLKDFISGSSDIVLSVDNLGYVRSCNLPAETILGFRKEDISGMEIRSIYKEQDVLDRDLNYVRNGGKVDNSYVNLITKSGELVPGTHSVRMLNSISSDSESEYLIIIKELGTKARLATQETQMRDMLNQLKKFKTEGDLKSQFIYNISHELKTPLTNIKGFSKLLYDGEFGTLNEEQKTYIKTTLDEADRLMLVIQQVLEAAKLESAKVKLELKEVDMTNISNNPSIKALEESAKNKDLVFEWKVDWNVPKIMADPNRLIQIFVNLIGNSIKFTEKGSIKVSIIKKSNKTIQCNIIDTGIGISEDDKKKLFKKKFFEVAKKSLVQQTGAGTGLGLSITKDLVALHGGTVGVESKIGEGSTFFFTLPIAPRQKRKSKNGQQQQTP